MNLKYCFILFSLMAFTSTFGQFYKILESDNNHVKISFNFQGKYKLSEKMYGSKKFNSIDGMNYTFRQGGEPWLPTENIKIGIPYNSKPKIKISSLNDQRFSNISIIPFPDSANQPLENVRFNETIYNTNKFFLGDIIETSTFTMRYINVASLDVSPYSYNPVSRELVFHKSFTVDISFETDQKAPFTSAVSANDSWTEEFAKTALLNPNEAVNFIVKQNDELKKNRNDVQSVTNWYNPTKNYYKIFLKDKWLYRVTYEYLVNAGVPSEQLKAGKLELLNKGVQQPIRVFDNNKNGLFDEGDYFTFIGMAPEPVDSFSHYNIYNNYNVYWFSYQADLVNSYKTIDGYPTNFDNQILTSYNTIVYEKDSLYERLGHAPDGKRDCWYWATAEARNGAEYEIFTQWMKDGIAWNIYPGNPDVRIRTNIQALTTTSCSNGYGHSIAVKFNTNVVATAKWNGAGGITVDQTFRLGLNGNPGIPLYLDQNKFEISADGQVCYDADMKANDIVLVNWFEFSYWRYNSVKGKAFIFKSPADRIGNNTYYMYQYTADNMSIYIPSRGELITNPKVALDSDQSVQFKDSVGAVTEYFCFANDAYKIPDSIAMDSPSDLQINKQGVDYLIITHKNFMSVAKRLADFRSTHLPEVSNPRIKIVDIEDIYDEYSAGLLYPWAVQDFIKNVFNNWQAPAVKYVVLIGDMSYDYRKIYNDNRPNFIPSIPFQSPDFGQAPSDNIFVDVAGNDMVPDIAIGRISIETVDQGNIFLDKLINYPADNSKDWKQNVLLMASGMNEEDEAKFAFNDETVKLQDTYLTPNGINASKVFRYPNKPEYLPFQGGGPKIREEFNKGAVIANYYGHGGGGQWDLTFTNDDIYQLNNGNKMPLVISVTCYTAHFDNQEIFGEIFDKIPGKGSIGFYGSSGLTWWQAGITLNNLFFDEVFNKKNNVLGSAILNSKYRTSTNTYILSQIALLHLLGDPATELAIPTKPDFVIRTNDISFSPENPVKGDTINFKVKLRNLGINFSDSVTVSLYQTKVDPANKIQDFRLKGFGEADSLQFSWTTTKAGLYTIICVVNDDNKIDENDHSDNKAECTVPVFDFSEPNIVKPLQGAVSSDGKMNFSIVDIGINIGRAFKYRVIVDTSKSLNSSAKILSPLLTPENGIVKWTLSNLKEGDYFWKAEIFDAVDTNRSKTYSFSVNAGINKGYFVSNRRLSDLQNYNMVYNYANNALQINAELLNPKPSDSEFLDSIRVNFYRDTLGITTLTTDGSYYYFAYLPLYKGWQPSTIYRVGTGLNGTTRGKLESPFPNQINVRSSLIYYSDGYLYASTNNDSTLIRLNRNTGDTSVVSLPDHLILSKDGLLGDSSGYYLASDGKYVYNLSAGEGPGNNYQKYIMRTLDPVNGWRKVGEDKVFDGSSAHGFCSFFVVNNKLFTYESYNSGYMRRFDMQNLSFEEEWIISSTFGLYSIFYDWIDNNVAASFYRPYAVYYPSIYRFSGTHKDAFASMQTDEIGPAYKWKNFSYTIDTLNSLGHYKAFLLGHNKATTNWDTLKTALPSSVSISDIDANKYNYLKMGMTIVDSSFGNSEPIKIKKIYTEFSGLPEISINSNQIFFTPDSLMQGFPTELSVKIENIGDSSPDSLALKYVADDADSAFLVQKNLQVLPDSSLTMKYTINTTNWSPASSHKIQISTESNTDELYKFNNLGYKSFYVWRDSTRPTFKITFDDKEISDGEIISAKPKIVMTLDDNSPLQLDTTRFTILYDGNQIFFSQPDVKFTATGYPNNQAKIEWAPSLKDGKHTLDVLAKDASGNDFDTVSHRSEFQVFNETDLKNIFNYPNPFKRDTYFTFELRGSQVPDELKIKVYTIAGRLIRDINVPSGTLRVGFNKLYWDGKDQDGDEISNGVYLYKIISKTGGVVKTSTEKFAKIK